eukprot:jgi/Mesvir1/26522/Mv16178-RA.1
MSHFGKTDIDTRSAFERITNGILHGAVAGAIGGSIYAAWGAESKVVTGFTGNVAAVAGAFALGEVASEAMLTGEKDHHLNAGVGGCAAGLVMGARVGSIPVACGMCAAMGSVAAFSQFFINNTAMEKEARATARQ